MLKNHGSYVGRDSGDGDLAARAQPPPGDLRLVDDEAVMLGRFDARCGSLRAVDVRDRAAPTADDVVVVVADARLVARGAPCRFDPADEPSPRKRAKSVIHGLRRDPADAFASRLGDHIDGGVVAAARRRQNSDPWARGTEPGRAKLIGTSVIELRLHCTPTYH